MFLKNLLSNVFDRLFGKPPEPPMPEPPVEETPVDTIASIASGNDNFETLVAALQATNGIDGLLDVALDPNADITVFAPTDAAFAELAKSLGIDVAAVLEKDPADVVDADVAAALATVLGADVVSQVLKYHVKVGGASLAELEEAGSVNTLVDLDGLATSFDVKDGELIDADPELENPEVIESLTDIAASNGTIQAIDRVLLPLDAAEVIAQPTIADIATGNDNFEILTAALIATNDINGLLDAAASRNADVTVFAPTDDAFIALSDSLGINVAEVVEKAPEDVVDADYATALATVLGAETVSDVLKYHVLGGGQRVDGLQEEKVLGTLLDGATLVIDGNKVVDADPQISNPELIDGLTDIEAANGQIQAIDAILLPFDLDPEPLKLKGSRSDDVLEGGGANDKLWGRWGDDVLSAGDGHDRLAGGAGNDTLIDGGGNDKSYGGRGDDTFIDGAGNDRSFGGRGNDTFIDGEGNDFYSGGFGADSFDFTNIEGDNKVARFDSHDELIFSSDDFGSALEVANAVELVRGGSLIEIEEKGSVLISNVWHLDVDDFQIV